MIRRARHAPQVRLISLSFLTKPQQVFADILKEVSTALSSMSSFVNKDAYFFYLHLYAFFELVNVTCKSADSYQLS